MNTAVRALPQNNEPFKKQHFLFFIKPSMGTLLLAIVVMLSGLAVVYTTDINRRLFMELQMAQTIQGQIRQEWGNLLLEESTWSTQARIQNLAQQHLEMSAPANDKIMIIKSSSNAPADEA